MVKQQVILLNIASAVLLTAVTGCKPSVPNNSTTRPQSDSVNLLPELTEAEERGSITARRYPASVRFKTPGDPRRFVIIPSNTDWSEAGQARETSRALPGELASRYMPGIEPDKRGRVQRIVTPQACDLPRSGDGGDNSRNSWQPSVGDVIVSVNGQNIAIREECVNAIGNSPELMRFTTSNNGGVFDYRTHLRSGIPRFGAGLEDTERNGALITSLHDGYPCTQCELVFCAFWTGTPIFDTGK